MPLLSAKDRDALSPQAALCYDHMATGAVLTAKTAHTQLGVRYLSARITELRDIGVKVGAAFLHDSHGIYRQYWLTEAPNADAR